MSYLEIFSYIATAAGSAWVALLLRAVFAERRQRKLDYEKNMEEIRERRRDYEDKRYYDIERRVIAIEKQASK